MPSIWWKKKTKSDSGETVNSFVGQKTDIIILVMGPTGVGKSTFILNYTKDKHVTVGHELVSCTLDVASYLAPMPSCYEEPLADRRLILVDTPGFDDSHGNDLEILQKISTWLVQVYEQRVPVAGIVYIADITQKRMNASLQLNLSMFTKLCGKGSYKKVTMVTSYWQDIKKKIGEMREAELKRSFWKAIIHGGARVRRIETLDGNYEEAIIQDVIQEFLESEPQGEAIDPLLIQYELVEWQKTIPKTQAGKALRSTLKEILKLKEQVEANNLDEKMRGELEAKKKSLQQQIGQLNLSMGERIVGFFGL
ncbi:P-loop containing nucleoside triphosphate hydrolase protein [Coprinopsis sp. MPI-PUGE-AT-0042]|nr:P-loop containing nucleoside triphosphate hydrolase protein [Coprinopsis sp. MPI-PUGE-AT-0042]